MGYTVNNVLRIKGPICTRLKLFYCFTRPVTIQVMGKVFFLFLATDLYAVFILKLISAVDSRIHDSYKKRNGSELLHNINGENNALQN